MALQNFQAPYINIGLVSLSFRHFFSLLISHIARYAQFKIGFLIDFFSYEEGAGYYFHVTKDALLIEN